MADAEARAWKIVLDSIEGRLLSGELAPGDHLQPERALATELNVGRSSVREALRVLEVFGLIRTQTGSGPQSGAIIIASPSNAIGALMRMQVAARGFQVGEIVRTRLLLETAVVGELAERNDTIDLAPTERLLRAMDDSRLTQAEFLALDAQFHLSLAEASENQVVATMMTGLRSSIEGYVLEGAAGLPDWTATVDRLRSEHRAILAAIVAGDRATATEHVHNHISGYYAETHLTTTHHTERPDHG
ncbi:FadR/GntR family transcriptional regulator [Parafrigoribacterium soli]|uniref:FadR/GntR family transcriptional regulator n=1 Tax=Parafrigoribacterium soli TaxID=3144663 RepID=UPI0032EC7F57